MLFFYRFPKKRSFIIFYFLYVLGQWRVFKNEAGIKYLLEKPEDKSILEMDVSKAEKELNFKPKYDLEAAIQDLKNYY